MNWRIRMVVALASLALVLSGVGPFTSIAHAGRPAPGGRTFTFSGYAWTVKSSAGKVGPGPNYFSSSTENVWVDGLGRLHLGLTYRNGNWYSSEVVNTVSLGRGTYSWVLESPVDALDPNVTLGLFTWNDRRAYNHREIDIEFARWGNPADPTHGQFVVQPYSTAGNLLRIRQAPAVGTSTQSFAWGVDSLDFASSGASPAAWTYRGPDVPVPGGENVRMNLWLFRGAAPTNGQEVEVVIGSFAFKPPA